MIFKRTQSGNLRKLCKRQFFVVNRQKKLVRIWIDFLIGYFAFFSFEPPSSSYLWTNHIIVSSSDWWSYRYLFQLTYTRTIRQLLKVSLQHRPLVNHHCGKLWFSAQIYRIHRIQMEPKIVFTKEAKINQTRKVYFKKKSKWQINP